MTSLFAIVLANGQTVFVESDSLSGAASDWGVFRQANQDRSFPEDVMIRAIGQEAEANIWIGPAPMAQAQGGPLGQGGMVADVPQSAGDTAPSIIRPKQADVRRPEPKKGK